MNAVFLVVSGLLLLLHLILDLKRLRKQHKSIKATYITLYCLTGCLFICIALGIKLPMPTRFFLNHVSPWMFSHVHP